LPGKSEIFFGDAAFIVRGERQRHLVITNINVGMMVELLSQFGDAVDEFNAIKESLKLESPKNGLRALRPIRNGFQVKVDLFGGQGWHNIELFLVPAGAALFAAAGEFVDGGPSAGFGGFQAETFLFVAGFDMRRLTFLFVRVAGFITLGHDGFFWVEIIFAKAFRGAAR
jgi:hypothetical protein